MPIGEKALNKFARAEIEAARRDPRTDRPRGSVVQDFWSAIEEAERTRTFGIAGLHSLTEALEREEQRLGVQRDDPDLDSGRRSKLQTAWERAEMAQAEITSQHPQLNAQALVSIVSALDALVEELAPAMRSVLAEVSAEDAMAYADQEVPDAAANIDDEAREAIRDRMIKMVAQRLAGPEAPRGAGAERYESVLRAVGLGAPPDRPIPRDLDLALAEVNSLRDVPVHRAGRIDARALRKAPSLTARYEEGELIRLNRDDWRMYQRHFAATHQRFCIGGSARIPRPPTSAMDRTCLAGVATSESELKTALAALSPMQTDCSHRHPQALNSRVGKRSENSTRVSWVLEDHISPCIHQRSWRGPCL